MYKHILAYRRDGRERLPLYHNFTTNPAPINGTCIVEPEEGYGHDAVNNPIKTLFNVTCSGYTDPEEPLNYTLNGDYTGI